MINYWSGKTLMSQSFYAHFFSSKTPLTDKNEQKIWFKSIHGELERCFNDANATAEAIQARGSLRSKDKLTGERLSAARDSINTQYQLNELVIYSSNRNNSDYSLKDPTRLMSTLMDLGFSQADVTGINVFDLLVCESVLFETMTKEFENYCESMKRDYSNVTNVYMPNDILHTRINLYKARLKPLLDESIKTYILSHLERLQVKFIKQLLTSSGLDSAIKDPINEQLKVLMSNVDLTHNDRLRAFAVMRNLAQNIAPAISSNDVSEYRPG